MKNLQYTIDVQATPQKLWHVLTDLECYKTWAKGFSPNSQFSGEWKTGSHIRFFDPDMGGTKAIVEEAKPFEVIRARHVAIWNKDGSEDTTGDDAKKWIGAIETYSLSEQGSMTRLTIDIKTHEDFVKMFDNSWDKALASIKELCEAEDE